MFFAAFTQLKFGCAKYHTINYIRNMDVMVLLEPGLVSTSVCKHLCQKWFGVSFKFDVLESTTFFVNKLSDII